MSIIADEKESSTVESVKEGLKVYKNPYGVLTNNPTFDYHLMNKDIMFEYLERILLFFHSMKLDCNEI